MASSTETSGGPGQPVLTLRRPRHHLDHLQHALRNNVMLVVTQESSKQFICYGLIGEFSQRFTKKWSVLVIDGCSEHCSQKLLDVLVQVLPSQPVWWFKDRQKSSVNTPCEETQNVLVITSESLYRCINNGYLRTEDISLLILNFCVSMNTALYHHSCHKQLLALCKNEKALTFRIIGLMCLNLGKIPSAVNLKKEFYNIESVYGLALHFSSDIIAMNNYGEEINVDYITYHTIPTTTHFIVGTIFNNLRQTLQFLLDINLPKYLGYLTKLTAILACAIDILILFGLWGFECCIESILSMLHGMEREKPNKIISLAIQACKSQFEIFGKLINEASNHSEALAQLVYKIGKFTMPYRIYCNMPNGDKEGKGENDVEEVGLNQETSEHGQNKNMVNQKTQKTCTNNLEIETRFNMKFVKPKPNKLFNCVIVTKSNLHAKLLSKSLNYLSSSEKDYNFLRSGYITKSEDGTTTNKHNQNVLRAVHQGFINVVVTTCDLSENLLITSCNVFMYFGVPETYAKFLKLKRKVKGLGPQFVLIVPEEEFVTTKAQLQVFKDIENVIDSYVHDFVSQTKKHLWLKHLENEPPSFYAPFGKDGPSVSMISSIHIVNKYCKKIARGDYSSIHPQFITHKKRLSDDLVSVQCKLYLPFTSIVDKVQKFSIVQHKPTDDLEFTLLKAKMEVSLECVKLLHEQGEMNDNLELVDKYFFDPGTAENYEIEDEGKGRAGTNKRKRAYEIKMPTFLEDNMPVVDQPSFLYKLQLKHIKDYVASRSHDYGKHPPPEIDLGIISRKQMPRFPRFVIYTSKHDIAVSLTTTSNTSSLYLDNTTIDLIRDFHQHIFDDLYKVNEHSVFSTTNGYLIAPLLTGTSKPCIHFDFLKRFSTKDAVDPSKTDVADKDFSIFENKLVRRLNQSVTSLQHTKYVVLRVCKDLSPSSAFPEPEVAETFADYYRNRYNVEVKPDQPLLLVRYVSSHINFLCPRHNQETIIEEAAKEERPITQIHLIPELCTILPLSASVWRIASYLPTIIYRLNTLLLAHELLSRIQRETGVGCEPWPDEVPLPELCAGNTVGEDRLEKVQAKESGDWTYMVTNSTGTQYYETFSPLQKTGDGDNEQNFVGVSIKECVARGNHRPEESFVDNLCQNNHPPAHGFMNCCGEQKVIVSHEVPRNKGTNKTKRETSPGSPYQKNDASDGKKLDNIPFSAKLQNHCNNHLTRLGGSIDSYCQMLDNLPINETPSCGSERLDTTPSNLTVNKYGDDTNKLPVSATTNCHNNPLTARHGVKLDEIPARIPFNQDTHLPLHDGVIEGVIPDEMPAKKDNHLPQSDDVGDQLVTSKPSTTTFNYNTNVSCLPPENHTFRSPPAVRQRSLFSPTVEPNIGPTITLILRSLTAKSSGQFVHSERLEVLGDVFLKLEVSLELYLTEDKTDEWELSIHRGHLVSNDMLSQQGRRIGLPGYMTTVHPDITKNYLPPGFMFSQDTKSQESGKSSGTSNGTNELSLNSYHHQVLGDKLVANCVESLIGGYLVSSGRRSTRRFLIWLGITKHTLEELEALFKSNNNSLVAGTNVEQDWKVGGTNVEESENVDGTNAVQGGNVDGTNVEQGRNVDGTNVEQGKNVDGTNVEQGRNVDGTNVEQGRNVDGTNVEQGKNVDGTNVEQGRNVDGTNVEQGRNVNDTNAVQGGNIVGTNVEQSENVVGINVEESENVNSTNAVQAGDVVVINVDGNEQCCDVLPQDELPYWDLPGLCHNRLLHMIEKEIGYRFKNKDFVVQAVMHTSYFRSLSPVSQSYQRIEFLGDAILDYLVTYYLFSSFPNLNRGDLTDFRSALVNNFMLAFLAVQSGLHKFLRCLLPLLVDVVAEFVKFVEKQEVKQGAPWKTSVCAFVVDNPEVDENGIEVPKVLADLFESLICAVFLDCGMDLEVVWNIFYPLLEPFIEYYKDHIPRSPVRILLETFPDQVTFSLARVTFSRKHSCNVYVVGYGNFEATGRTPKIAKSSVARKAIQHIRSISPNTFTF